MGHRQKMLEAARYRGATHIAIIDADEILTGNRIGSIRDSIELLATGTVLQVPLYNLRHGIGRYHSNGIWGDRWVSVAFADDPHLSWSGDRFHHREPNGCGMVRFAWAHGTGGVMHLWGASEKRLIAKHRMYRVTERIRWPERPVAEIERMYSMATDGRPEMGDTPATWRYANVPETWWAPYRDMMPQYLHLMRDPWQNAECDRLIALHGRDYFTGLRV